MGEITLALLECDDCTRNFKRALREGWVINKYISIMCHYNRDPSFRCHGGVAKVVRILPPGKF